MANKNQLSDAAIAKVASILSSNDAKRIAVIYMGTQFHELDEWKGEKDTKVTRTLMGRWRNRSRATVQV